MLTARPLLSSGSAITLRALPQRESRDLQARVEELTRQLKLELHAASTTEQAHAEAEAWRSRALGAEALAAGLRQGAAEAEAALQLSLIHI